MKTHAAPWVAMGLADIVEASPRSAGPDRRTVRNGVVALISMLAAAALVGGAAGVALVWAGTKMLAYLS